jgi:hypothetical protein
MQAQSDRCADRLGLLAHSFGLSWHFPGKAVVTLQQMEQLPLLLPCTDKPTAMASVTLRSLCRPILLAA